METKQEEKEKERKAFLEQLTPLQRQAYDIEKNHLGTSFDIDRSNGFNEWRKNKNK